jgi:HEAT repeat protein
LGDWNTEVHSTDVTTSNQANAVLNTEIIPWLAGKMLHDTNDSSLRVALVDMVNNLNLFETPVVYNAASVRREMAAGELGGFGPQARPAIPALMQALQSNDLAVHESAIQSLGAIHGEPEIVIPLLIKYLDDDQLNDEAATALGNFGSLARPAVPKIIPLLHAADDDAQAAAAEALKKIDPAAYASATNAPGN